MGYPASAESQNHLPQTPPDYTSYSSSHASSVSTKYSAQHQQPPQDLSWPHPKPPISPPMSSHDQPPSRLAKLPSPVRPSSSGSSSGGSMPAATSAPMSAVTGRPPCTTTTADPSPTSSPRKNDAPRPHVRETLPSLSSIFGPPENIRPLHSSPLERPRGASLTPTGPPMSLPMDQRHSPSFSYFAKAATPPASVMSTLSQSSQPLPQPPRSVYQDDHSPRQEAASHPWSDPRSGYTVANRQTYTHAHSPTDSRGPAPSDYHTRQHEQPSSYGSYRDLPHQFSPQPPPMGPSRSPVRAPGPVASMPPIPSAYAFPDGIIIPKEGLGPRIWTGADFLPQFMRAAELPGEGLCFFYDDGSHCKAIIDGETVNPFWGVTKAGKPRKRLAIACMTCREKKIKCDPEYPRCVQCEKFGRVCKFKNAPRGGNNVSPRTTSSSEPEIMRRMAPVSMTRPPPESPQAMAYSVRSSVSNSVSNTASSPGAGMRRPSSPDHMNSASAAFKRARTDYDHYTAASRGRSPSYVNVSPTSAADAPRVGSALPPVPWGHDPCYTRDNMHVPSSSSYSQMSPQSQSLPSYQHRHYDDYRRSQPASPSHVEPPHTLLLPPPRSGPETPQVHSDGMARSWLPELRHHGRA